MDRGEVPARPETANHRAGESGDKCGKEHVQAGPMIENRGLTRDAIDNPRQRQHHRAVDEPQNREPDAVVSFQQRPSESNRKHEHDRRYCPGEIAAGLDQNARHEELKYEMPQSDQHLPDDSHYLWFCVQQIAGDFERQNHDADSGQD